MAEPTTGAPTYGSITPSANAPLLPTMWQESEKRLRREESTRPSDYVSSIFRQDGFIDGMVASYVGSRLEPQEGYFVGADPDWPSLREGLWQEYESELYKAVSPVHARLLKDRLLQKQEDLVRLGDLGLPGEIGRFALNVVMPENLLFGLTGFTAARVTQGVANAGRSRVGAALANAEARVAAGTGRAVAAGTALGAAENAAFEKLRQEFNFENSTSQVVEALLMGGVFSLPISALGARAANRMAAAAEREVATLKALEKAERGEALDAADAKVIRETVEVRNAMDDLQRGRIDQDEFTQRVEKTLSLEDDARQWLDQLSADLSRQGRTIIDEFFPGGRQPARPRPAPAAETIPTTNGAPPVAPADPAAPVASVASVDAFNANNPAVRNTGLSGLAKLLDQRREARARVDADEVRRKQENDAWAAVERSRAEAREREMTAMERLRQIDLMGQDPEAPATAPAAPVAPVPTPAATPVAAAPDAPPVAPEVPGTAVGPATAPASAAAAVTSYVKKVVAGTLERIREYYKVEGLDDLQASIDGARNWLQRLEADENNTSAVMRDKNIQDSLDNLQQDVRNIEAVAAVFPRDAARALEDMGEVTIGLGTRHQGLDNLTDRMARSVETDVPFEQVRAMFDAAREDNSFAPDRIAAAMDTAMDLAREASARAASLLQKNGRAPNTGTRKREAWDEAMATAAERREQWAALDRLQRAAAKRRAQSDMPAVDAPPVDPVVAELSAPARTAESFVGQRVSWVDKNGDEWDGEVLRLTPNGRLLVRDAYTDQMKSVAHTEVDQFDRMSEAPEGFLPGSIGAAQISQIANVATQVTAMSKIRLDYFAVLNRSENPQTRELVYRLVKDAIQTDDNIAQGWTASEYKKQMQRTLGGAGFHVPFARALDEAHKVAGVKFWQRSKFNSLFAELVTRETRGDPSVGQLYPSFYPQVQKAAKAMKDTYAKALEEMQRAGVEGSLEIPPNDLYVNRVWRTDRIREAIAKHGEQAVYALVAKAIRVPNYANNVAKAESFIKTVMKLEFDAHMQNVALAPRDMATLRNELAATGQLTPQEIDDLVDLMFDARATGAEDAGRPGNLKYRFDLDETITDTLPTGNLGIHDLLENDARVLVDTYLNSVGGHTGLAKVGIKSAADWRRALNEVANDPSVATNTSAARESKYLEDLYRHITGRPMSVADFSGTARIAQALRGYTRSVTLGQLGITAAFEMHRSFALFGVRAMMQSMPTFMGFLRAIRQGYVPEKGLAEDIMMATGLGTEMASAYARALELEGGFAYGALTRVEHFSNQASHVIDVLSGNASFTPLTRQLAAMGATRQAYEVAMGRRKLTPAEKRRWVGQGVSDNPTGGRAGTSDLDQMLDALKTWSTPNAAGTLESIDFENWAKNDRGTYDTFTLFVSRQARDAIQDHDIGETMPWMHTTLGKMVAELKTFMLVAHAKNFAKNLEYRDMTSASLLMIGIMAESLAYSIQTSINFPQELDERLTAERIASAVASRLAMGGFTSVLAGTGYHILTGGDALFDAGSTKNTDSRVAFQTPSLMVGQKLLNLPSLFVGDFLGPGTATQKEVRDGLSGLPGARLIGVPAAIRYFSEGLPTSDPDAEPR